MPTSPSSLWIPHWYLPLQSDSDAHYPWLLRSSVRDSSTMSLLVKNSFPRSLLRVCNNLVEQAQNLQQCSNNNQQLILKGTTRNGRIEDMDKTHGGGLGVSMPYPGTPVLWCLCVHLDAFQVLWLSWCMTSLVITPSSSGHKAGCSALSPDPEALQGPRRLTP